VYSFVMSQKKRKSDEFKDVNGLPKAEYEAVYAMPDEATNKIIEHFRAGKL